jgi:putative ATP-binding cassette transporter
MTAPSSALLDLVRRESRISLRRLLLMAAVSALGSALVLMVVNTAATRSLRGESAGGSFQHLVLFALALALAAIGENHILDVSVLEIERILDRVRTRLADKIRRVELLPLEDIGRAAIYTSLTRETATLSQAVRLMTVAVRSAILVVLLLLYLASLSVAACVLTLVLSAVGVFLYLPQAKQAQRDLEAAAARENEFFDTITHLLEGFKEVKLHRGRSDELFARAQAVSASTAEMKIQGFSQFTRLNVFSQSLFYVLVAAIVFVLPSLTAVSSEVVIKATATVLFIIGPIASVVTALPSFASASVAAEGIKALETALDRHLERQAPTGDVEDLPGFREIRLEQVVFQFTGPEGRPDFRLGPVDLTVRAGETLFLSGGNGSGKTTLLRLLTGLYHPQSGRILLDGQPVDAASAESYRSLFSTVFSDYHLFDHLYGLSHVPAAEVTRVLRDMELTGKTKVVDHRFTTLSLSSGQRKRLALAVALLEDRPLYVFDEWAAEQDPEFRQRFYEVILPRLKERGKTLVVVTHDERYYQADYIDEMVKLVEGRRQLSPQGVS